MMDNEELKNEIEEKEVDTNEYSGVFHEKDSHDVNDIVKEISDSLIIQ